MQLVPHSFSNTGPDSLVDTVSAWEREVEGLIPSVGGCRVRSDMVGW